MSDGTGLAEALLGLPGFWVLEVREDPGEVVIWVETTVEVVGCSACGVRAESQDRMPVEIRDLACFGRPARLVWNKRRWRCREELCAARTWTETHPEISSRVVLTRRAGMDACRQVGECARPVAGLAAELGVCWWTVMGAVREHGQRLVDDPARVGTVRQLGVDETSFLAATRDHPTLFATGLVDLQRHILIDMTEGNAAGDLRRWCATQDPEWLKAVRVVATDLTNSYRAGLSPHLDHVTRVADPFHVVRAANRCLDQVRRRVQQRELGHRGRKHDPLYRIRKVMLAGNERLDDRGRDRMLLGLRYGDPYDEVLGAWLAKENVRDVYLAPGRRAARTLLTKTIAGCAADDVKEIRTLGETLANWKIEILAHHATGASNGPTEGLNLCVKKVKRCGHGFRSFENYRLRVLLHAGGITWPIRPRPPRIRTRSPHSDARRAPLSLAEPTGRYLSFAEREDLALLRAQGLGVRAIARAMGRDPATISRELRRNAATLGHDRRSLTRVWVQLLGEIDMLIHELPERLRVPITGHKTVRAKITAFNKTDWDLTTEAPATALRIELLASRIELLQRTLAEDAAATVALTELVDESGSTLTDLVGIAPRAAAEILVETGDIGRFTEAGFARYTGTAPVPASSGEGPNQPVRHRLSRGGNRKLNAAIHGMAMIQLRYEPRARALFDQAQARGHTRREAMRILKRHLAAVIYRTMLRDAQRADALT